MYIYYDIMVVTINWANIPHGVTGKEPPPDKGVPDQSLQDLTMILDSGMNQNNNIANLELFKLMVEHTEHGNVRIRKLNELGKQKRINSSGLCEVSEVKRGTSAKLLVLHLLSQ